MAHMFEAGKAEVTIINVSWSNSMQHIWGPLHISLRCFLQLEKKKRLANMSGTMIPWVLLFPSCLSACESSCPAEAVFCVGEHESQ